MRLLNCRGTTTRTSTPDQNRLSRRLWIQHQQRHSQDFEKSRSSRGSSKRQDSCTCQGDIIRNHRNENLATSSIALEHGVLDDSCENAIALTHNPLSNLKTVHARSKLKNGTRDVGADDTMNLEFPDENWNLDTEEFIPEPMDISVFSTPTRYSPRLLPKNPSPIFASYQPKDSGTFCRLYNQPVPNTSKAFALRKPSNNQFSLNRSYILCTLPTYPSMLLPSNDDGLPSFIHPHFNSRKALPAPLATCVTLIQWINVKNKDNLLFIWGCIRMEIDRICVQYTTYNREDSVAALQAIMIYLLLQISEDDEKATNFDIPSISAMIKVSMHVIHLAEDLQNEGVPSWKEWALAESTRRTIIILFFIDIFFEISTSVPEYRCDGNRLKHMTLPCSRKLWTATTNEAWENEPEDRRLDGWLSQLDDFGMLVLAAASLAS
ncbi:hypothetical protein BHYA_0137g00260 [Botrytis hyacinthi]|uniref:Transcription factor domain-containing protein n=1 Tax=Botrytis hyacinthi TaxID=278943 RepID=A0A4Z1GH77_9HELO|nr:hypothetical protein BHYA_0137g00260 [Botrytis hyacinthi]